MNDSKTPSEETQMNYPSDDLITISIPRVQLSHELLTPLNAILGFTQVLQSEKNMSPGHIEAVEAIHKASEKLLRRINELFQISDSPSKSIDYLDFPENQEDFTKESRILIVDDTSTNRLVLKNMLSTFSNVILDEAKDGFTALKKIEQNLPHIILMDLYMPKMDGFETAKKIRSNPLYDNIAMIAISADSYAFDEKKLKDHGFNSFLGKPVKMAQLKAMIIELCKNIESNNMSEKDRDSFFSFKGLFPDQKSLEKLIKFSRQGAYSEIKQYLNKLEEKHPEYIEFILLVQKSLKKFQFKNIISMIQAKLVSTKGHIPNK
ncbi:Signal transduction response regulator, receiver region domain protein [Candidatus Magnetomorum sp. HK-1]|nr:Signal transduction response regulator, receiver region domain protein [Candidatus Magnetomorum sp. HK-1]